MPNALPILLMAAAMSGIGSSSHAQSVQFERDSPLPLVHYQEVISELAAEDPGPSVAVYGDGRVVVAFPPYMKRAGTYELRLAAPDLERLLEELVADGVADFDAEAIQQARRSVRENREQARSRAPAAASEMHIRTDATTTVIVSRVRSASARRQSTPPHTARWTGLRADAEAYPELPALARLATAEQRLRSLMERQDLRRID